MVPTYLVKLVIRFFKNSWGSIQTPYKTYRRLIDEDPYQLLIIFSLVAAYFFLVSPIKLHTFHPFLLTINTSKLFTVVLATYIGICLVLLVIGKALDERVSLRAVLLTWGYTLIPTLLWFLATTLFYVVLPPPRTDSLMGKSFSILYIAFSLSMFWWKGILYYLTLRFGLFFDLKKIVIFSSVFLPILAFYSLLLYRLGIFKVPFI